MRPTVVRADTLDLQDHDQPSAKDHNAQPGSPALKAGLLAPSQATAIMHVVQEQNNEQHDMIMAQNGGNSKLRRDDNASPHDHDANNMEDDITDEDDLDEDLLDKMSSSPSISDEDIDFEFVYALHTFIATVEGQANATKGDTMVLLDDSNSYWWLVRVVKDSSIGYLPAEHIETPSERLARLNKHRNVDLSTPMLGDNAEKSKNPLKKAMRRRNGKTVQFAPPTYVDAVEIDYSTEEEDMDYASNEEEGDSGDEERTTNEASQDEETTLVDQSDTITDAKASNDSLDKPTANGESRNSDEAVLVDKDEITSAESKSRKGLKHPDSAFFNNDDSSEPKRITLTPQLFRDDAAAPTSAGPVGVTPIKESKSPKTSFDKSERHAKRDDTTSPPPTGKEKNKKEKKSMLGSFFKKRSKSKSKDEEIEEFLHSEKRSTDSLRDDRRSESRDGNTPNDSPLQSQQQLQTKQQQQQQQQQSMESKGPLKRQQTGPLSSSTTNTIRTIEQIEETEELPLGIQFAGNGPDMTQSTIRTASPEKKQLQFGGSTLAPSHSPRPYQSQEDMRSNHSVSPLLNPSPQPKDSPQVTPILGGDRSPNLSDRHVTESPVLLNREDPPSLVVDTSSGSEENNFAEVSPIDTTSDSHDVDFREPPSPEWSTSSLKSYFEDENNDIRDFLVVVNHKSDVSRVDTHPEIVPLFADANIQLKDLTNRLDGMLGKYLQSRTRR